jgi:hypothetical protein
MIGNQGLTERRYTRRRVHGGLRARREPAWGQASSVKRQASSGGRRVGRVGAAGKRRGRGLGAIMYHVATYLLCIPRALSRLTGGPWYVMGASECRPMCKNAAAARRQPQATMQRLSQAHGGRVEGLDRAHQMQSAECRVQSAKRLQSPLQSPLQPAGGDAVCAAGAFAPKLSSQKSTTY